MKNIFLSYSRADETEANNVAKALDELGLEYFRDVKNIDWGKDVDSEVKVGLNDCIAVLVVVTVGSLKSQWVPYEIGYASGLRKRILPYVTNKNLDLPEYIRRLNYVTSIEEIRKHLSSPKIMRELISPSSEIAEVFESKYLEWWERQNEQRIDSEIEFLGFRLHVDSTVFSPSVHLTYSSYFVSRFLKNLRGKKVLDMGTGCGALAIIAAKRNHAAQILATDIDQSAIENAERNIKKFRLSKKITVIKSDLFDNVEGEFDVIIANLPIAFSAATWSHLREDFKEMIPRWATGVRDHLVTDGKAYLTWASFGDQKIIPNALSAVGLIPREFSQATFGVKWQVYEISKAEVAMKKLPLDLSE